MKILQFVSELSQKSHRRHAANLLLFVKFYIVSTFEVKLRVLCKLLFRWRNLDRHVDII